jgi:non-ribosomal peptide synthetase component E (peptide arylation enzyme)
VRLVDVVTSPARRAAYLAIGAWDDSTLSGRLADHVTHRADDLAVVDEHGRYTYGRLGRDVAAFAASLAGLGVEPGSVVSVQLPNRYEAVVAACAIGSLGAVINPLLPNYRRHELEHVVATARPVVVITPDIYRDFDHRQLIADVVAATGVAVHHVVVGEPGGSAVGYDALVVADGGGIGSPAADAVSELIFTSGTEATPKAIMHTEQTANFSVRVAHSDLAMTPQDVVWMPSPVGHSTGFNYGLRFAIYHGLPLVLQDRWDAATAVELVARERCTYTLAATTFLQDLLDRASLQQVRLDSLSRFGCGGAPVPPRLVEAASERGVTVLRLYGSTEVLVGTWNRPWSTLDQRRFTDGVAMSGIELDVRDSDGRPVAAGTPGELVVRGPDTCVGFFNDPARTSATFDAEGWVRSGDTVTIDADGYLTVVGRTKEILIRGGINIAPREIEDLLCGYPEVERAAVIGLPDERLGERMCACVVLRPGLTLTLDEVVERMRAAGVATYKWPQRLEVLDSLPATASGKIRKHELVASLQQRTET